MRIALCFIVLTLAALPQPEQRPRGAAPAPVPQGMPPVVQTCVPCHGTRGEGKPDAGFPRIAGQSSSYLARQLDSYASGSRRDPTMEPIAKGLSPELRATVAAHYAQVAAPAAASASALTAPWAQRGRVLATSGDRERGVQACINCHGPGGTGQPPAAPYLAGLDDGYIRATLNAWKEGRRSNDAGQQMAVIAKALSSEDIDAVSRYYAGETSPRPAPANLVQAGDPQLLPSGMTRSMTVDTTAPEHSGSEGRAPLTGGGLGLGQSGRSANDPGASDTRRSGASGSSSRDASKPPDDRPVSSGDPARGRALVASGAYGCTACHIVPGIRAPRGIVGPALGDLGQRPFIAGQLPNTPDMLVAFLRNPPSLVPATGMPDVGLSVEDARHIAAYLHTLAPGE
jgi:cytochrome c553/cytochrome c2